MKNAKENKKENPSKEAHTIHIPPPPQEMDPSKPPKGNAGVKKNNPPGPKNEPDKKETLSPKEEL